MVDEAFETMDAAKQRAKPKLFAIPGVHAVGLGPKQVGGKPTNVPAIIVCVVKKKPLASIPAGEVIPGEIEGFKTDVVEMAIPNHMADDVNPVDDITSKPRPIMGGVQIQVATSQMVGTLGFLAVRDTPNAEVVAVTNWHVVAPGTGTATNLALSATVSGNTVFLAFSQTDTKPIPAGSVAYFAVSGLAGPPTGYDFYVESFAGDTPTLLAARMAGEINALGAPGIQASVQNPNTTISITAGGAPKFGFETFGPTHLDPNCDLKATTTKDTITLSGRVPDTATNGYGLFVSVNFSSAEHASQGFFLSIPKGQTLEEIAQRIALAFQDLNPLFAATVSGRVVSLSPASQIDVFAWRDIRAGQPWNNLATGCSDCCVDEIGSTIAADHGLDAGLVQLNPDRVSTYLAEVLDVGYIAGTHVVTVAEAMAQYAVTKRGRTTGVRSGRVDMLGLDGIIAPEVEIPNWPKNKPKPKFSPRKYDGAMRIVSTTSTSTDFSAAGDSGSAILHPTGGKAHDLVGLLFGGFTPDPKVTTPQPDPYTLATPIQPILDRFQIHAAVATNLGQEKTVPPQQSARRAATASLPITMPFADVERRVADLQQEMSTTSSGRAYVDVMKRHAREVNLLVNKNRRVAVAWQRSGGPVIVSRFLEALRDPARPLPSEIMGEPWRERLAEIARALKPYASDGLQRELDGPTWALLLGVGGKNTEELLEQLRHADGAVVQPPPTVARDAAPAPPGE